MNNQTSFIVHITDEYEIFNVMETNRSVDPRHVKVLKDSIKEHGVLVNPVLVNSKMEVVDGQHRLEACKQSNSSVYYLIVGDYGIKEVQALNLNQKNWTQIDYAESFSSMGYEHYKKLLSFVEENDDFGFSSCVRLLQNSTASKYISTKRSVSQQNANGTSKIKQVFEEGTWEINDEKKANEWVNYLRDIGQYYSGYNRTTFVNAMISLFNNPKFDKDEFMRKLSYQSNALNDCSNVGQYIELIEEIYNFKKRDKVNLRY